MILALELLHKYAATFRRMINIKVQGSKQSIKQLLKLNKEEDWNFLAAAMDIIDDASSAIGNVERFGLSGPTKLDEIGERYLRLYGLLSASYIQQQSILTIYKLMNVPDPKSLRKKFDKLKIRELRHKLSSHGTDFLNPAENVQEAYVPLRLTLGDTEVTAVRYSSSILHEKINLRAVIETHIRLVVEAMDQITEKSIETIFKDQANRKMEFMNELADLRIEKSGGLVLKSKKGPKIVVTFISPKRRHRSRPKQSERQRHS
jgi:hypothetical protein